MSDRPIAEIIGWERHEREAAWKQDGSVAYTAVWHTPPGVTDVHGLGGSPTVDDILAWLKSERRTVKISGGTPGHCWQVRITRPDEPDQWVLFSRSGNATTLLAALEEAVHNTLAAEARTSTEEGS